jgi:hypothetical protein
MSKSLNCQGRIIPKLHSTRDNSIDMVLIHEYMAVS